jgi:hypothetical protein
VQRRSADRAGQATGFAAMFAASDEPHFTEVPIPGAELQRDAEAAAAPAAAEPTPDTAPAAPSAGPAVGGSPPPAAPATGVDLEEMARRLFDPLSARLRAELWLDRERAGLVTDLRP